jgi:hypothetical protein
MGRYLNAIKKQGNTLEGNLINLNNLPLHSSLGSLGSIPASFEIIQAANDAPDINQHTVIFSPAVAQDDPNDDRRTCRQCANLRGSVCSAARPGGTVSAKHGYTPGQMFREELHRCEGYAAKP